jgi:hypothetical protein
MDILSKLRSSDAATKDSDEIIRAGGFDKVTAGSAEAAEEPDRNIEHISNILSTIRHGDKLKIILGTSSVKVSIRGDVVGIKGQNSDRPPEAGWKRTVEIEGPEGNDKKGRLYRTGTGGDKTDPWLIYSYEYYRDLDMIDEADAGWHGWVIDLEKISVE